MNILGNKKGGIFVKKYDKGSKHAEEIPVGQSTEGFPALKLRISDILKAHGSKWKKKYDKKLNNAINNKSTD